MRVYANVMVKNEALLVDCLHKYWSNYPVDHWVFFDDKSTDGTDAVIEHKFGSSATILRSSDTFNESANRSAMFEFSRESGADVVLSIDADELLSANILSGWDYAVNPDANYYWYSFNCVESISKRRSDGSYGGYNCCKNYFIPVKHAQPYDLSLARYHSPRMPRVSLPAVAYVNAGMIHLQSINRRFYALKQLWYKHFEYVNYGFTVDQINSRYDREVNNLDFYPCDIDPAIYNGIEFDPSLYDDIERVKGYRDYVLENRVDGLVTFGGEYL